MMLEMTILVGLATAYVVAALRFEYKEDHWGPWPHPHNKVLDLSVSPPYSQPVTLFDRIRAVFGVYDIEKEQDCDEDDRDVFDDCEGLEHWYINSPRMEVWMCPKCLSFWAAIPFAVLAALVQQDLVVGIFSWFGGAFVSFAVNRWLIYLEDQQTLDELFVFADAEDDDSGGGGLPENK